MKKIYKGELANALMRAHALLEQYERTEEVMTIQHKLHDEFPWLWPHVLKTRRAKRCPNPKS